MSRLFVLYPSYVVYAPVWRYYGFTSDGQNTNVI